MFTYIFLFIIGVSLGIGSFIGYQTVTKPLGKESPKETTFITSTPAISYSLIQAPTNSLRAEIVSMDGDILWRSRVATEPAALDDMIALQQGEKIGTQSKGTVEFAIGRYLRVTLARDSLVSLTQTLPRSIVLTQEKGRASYVLDSRTQPVAIRIRRLLVRIKHGSIRISAPEDQSDITVAVEEGSAEVAYNDAEFTSQRMIIAADETFTFDNDTREGNIE